MFDLLTMVGVVFLTSLGVLLFGFGLKMLKRPGSTSFVACSLAGSPIELLLTEWRIWAPSIRTVVIIEFEVLGWMRSIKSEYECW